MMGFTCSLISGITVLSINTLVGGLGQSAAAAAAACSRDVFTSTVAQLQP